MSKPKENFRIVFMGTPDFAVASLKALVEQNFNVVGVVTSADKPAGRGQKMAQSAVKIYAEQNNLPVLQPANLKDTDFIEELKALKADLQIIVAFRMLPVAVWGMPPMGSINLHASLLPHYRGAAPINWSVINGEEKTGVTTFFLKHEIDTGDIILQEEVVITDSDNAGTIHDKLMEVGAKLLTKTVQSVIDSNYTEISQQKLINETLKHAPKIFKSDCKIDWSKSLNEIHNLIRGLSPYPAAWTELIGNDSTIGLKIFETEKIVEIHAYNTGTILSDGKLSFKVAVKGGFIDIKELQLAGKKRIKIRDFLLGFKHIDEYRML